MTNDLIRPVKAAKLMNYSYSYVCSLARAGHLRRHYAGTRRSYLLSKSEILAFLHQRVVN